MFCEGRDGSGNGPVKSARHEIPDPGISGPAGSERGAEDVYTLLPPCRIQYQPPEHLPKVGQTAVVPGSSGDDTAVKVNHVPHQCLRPNPADGDRDVRHNTYARAHFPRYPG
jgi:hypothetical protein